MLHKKLPGVKLHFREETMRIRFIYNGMPVPLFFCYRMRGLADGQQR